MSIVNWFPKAFTLPTYVIWNTNILLRKLSKLKCTENKLRLHTRNMYRMKHKKQHESQPYHLYVFPSLFFCVGRYRLWITMIRAMKKYCTQLFPHFHAIFHRTPALVEGILPIFRFLPKPMFEKKEHSGKKFSRTKDSSVKRETSVQH